MSFRSLMLVAAIGALGAVGCVASGDASEDQSSVAQNVGGSFGCYNGVVNVVTCNETALLLPVTINIKDVRVLNDNELNVLTDNLNDLSISLKDVLNISKILDDNEVKVFDILNGFNGITVTKNDINVCVLNALGIQVCK